MNLCRADRTLLSNLNLGMGPSRPIEPEQIDRLLELGLIVQGLDEQLEITARGQLELMRQRYHGLARQRFVVIGSDPRAGLWQKIANFRRSLR